jgi:hypothetical protein
MVAFLGGQFKSPRGGQFESSKGGQLESPMGGQFHRLFHFNKGLHNIYKYYLAP